MKLLRQHLTSIYMWSIVAVGTALVLYSAVTLPAGIVDGYFLLLTLITAVIGSHIAIRIPRINVNITVEDTFVFIALLLYGGQAAVILGAWYLHDGDSVRVKIGKPDKDGYEAAVI